MENKGHEKMEYIAKDIHELMEIAKETCSLSKKHSLIEIRVDFPMVLVFQPRYSYSKLLSCVCQKGTVLSVVTSDNSTEGVVTLPEKIVQIEWKLFERMPLPIGSVTEKTHKITKTYMGSSYSSYKEIHGGPCWEEKERNVIRWPIFSLTLSAYEPDKADSVKRAKELLKTLLEKMGQLEQNLNVFNTFAHIPTSVEHLKIRKNPDITERGEFAVVLDRSDYIRDEITPQNLIDLFDGKFVKANHITYSDKPDIVEQGNKINVIETVKKSIIVQGHTQDKKAPSLIEEYRSEDKTERLFLLWCGAILLSKEKSNFMEKLEVLLQAAEEILESHHLYPRIWPKRTRTIVLNAVNELWHNQGGDVQNITGPFIRKHNSKDGAYFIKTTGYLYTGLTD